MGFPENIKLQSNSQPYAIDRAKCLHYRDVLFFFLLNINSGSASFYKEAFTCSSGAVNGYIWTNRQNDNSYADF